MEKNLWTHILRVREKNPLVLNITNYVVMNNTANALLAVGASPIMAHATSEIKELLAMAGALVINIGTLDKYWADCMLLAANEANERKVPWVLDPVGAGATGFRDAIISKLLQYQPVVVRGNASEIIALTQTNTLKTKGVDSSASSSEAMDAAFQLATVYGTTVCVSGETDIITNGEQTMLLSNGHALMTKVTGLGCTATAIIGAFINPGVKNIEAIAAALSLLNIAGAIAAGQSNGPGSLQLNLIDKLYNITEEEFTSHLKIENKCL